MLVVTAVRDRVAERFLGVQLTTNVKVACRGFVNAMADLSGDRSDLLVTNPDDFDLWHLGNFDDDSGRFDFSDHDYPRCIFTGSAAVRMLESELSFNDFVESDSDLVPFDSVDG